MSGGMVAGFLSSLFLLVAALCAKFEADEVRRVDGWPMGCAFYAMAAFFGLVAVVLFVAGLKS